MQIVEKSGEGLSRVYGVTVPAADLTSKLEARIKETQTEVRRVFGDIVEGRS